MSSRINLDASLWNLYCLTETWDYAFKSPTRKMIKRSHDEWKGNLSRAICLFAAFLMSSIIKLNSICRKDLSFFSLLIKLFGHFNLSILRISSHFKWEFFVNAKNVVVFFVVLCGANETSEFSFGEGSSSILFLT